MDGQETRLTAKEYSILLLLMEHPGQVFSAEQIYEHVWEESADFAVENTVMVLFAISGKRLRSIQKIRDM